MATDFARVDAHAIAPEEYDEIPELTEEWFKMAKKYEGSKADKAQDKKGAKKMGVSLKAYEKTSRDTREDAIGQKNQRQFYGKKKAR